jgi:hypothetical protein
LLVIPAQAEIQIATPDSRLRLNDGTPKPDVDDAPGEQSLCRIERIQIGSRCTDSAYSSPDNSQNVSAEAAPGWNG